MTDNKLIFVNSKADLHINHPGKRVMCVGVI